MLSILASGYAAMSFIYYSWLNAADPENWPAERVAVWAYSSLGLSVIFFGVFIYCVVKLFRASRNAPPSQT